jgi:hypothetical protein
MYLTTCNILIDSDVEGLKKYDFYFISRNPGETINKPLFPKQPGWINDDNNLYLVGKNPEEAYSWRYIYYKGNIEHFKQPKMTIAEYKERFNKEFDKYEAAVAIQGLVVGSFSIGDQTEFNEVKEVTYIN